MTELDETEIRRRYAAGESLRALADDYGVAVDTIVRRVPDRRPQGRTPRADVSTAEIVRLHDEDGLSMAEIAARLKINKSTVSRRYGAATA